MTPRFPSLPRGAVITLASIIAVVLAWRVLVVNPETLQRRADAPDPLDPDATRATPVASARERLSRNPYEALTMLDLSRALEAEGKKDEAGAALQEALRLAPRDGRTLTETAAFYMRAGDDARALTALRLSVDAAGGDVHTSLWEFFVDALDADRNRDFFDGLARENPGWWPRFFRLACERAANVGALRAVYATRVDAARATLDERRCMLERLQRDGYWANAYQLWLDGLPPDQRANVSYVFNGGFELPLSNFGFDWRVPAQQGVTVSSEPAQGATGRSALSVAFVRQRYSQPPLYQYLLLSPGRYRLEGRGRADLESWLGLQWGVYCNDAAGGAPRQLVHTASFSGSLSWREFGEDFVVPRDCQVQLLRLELANPKRDANAPGAVVVRLNGNLWFDDLNVRSAD